MSELLPALAFGVVIGAQFLAVVAVHGMTRDKFAGRADLGERADVFIAARSERV